MEFETKSDVFWDSTLKHVRASIVPTEEKLVGLVWSGTKELNP